MNNDLMDVDFSKINEKEREILLAKLLQAGRLNLHNPNFNFEKWKKIMCEEFGWKE